MFNKKILLDISFEVFGQNSGLRTEKFHKETYSAIISETLKCITSPTEPQAFCLLHC